MRRWLASSMIAFAFAFAFGSGCATTPATESGPPTAADYAPLKVGASWTYAVQFPGQKGERTITILRNRDGYFEDDAGGGLRHTPQGLRDRLRFLIREPLQAGLKWKAIVSASAVERYEIQSVGEECSAMAGLFSDCLVIRGSIRQDEKHTLHSEFTWARGVGLVKITTELEREGQRIPQTSQSLLHYSLTPRPQKTEPAPPAQWSR